MKGASWEKQMNQLEKWVNIMKFTFTSWRHAIFMSSSETNLIEEFPTKENLQLLGGVIVQRKSIYIWMENTFWRKNVELEALVSWEGCLELPTGLLQPSLSRASKVSLMCLTGQDICKMLNSVSFDIYWAPTQCKALWLSTKTNKTIPLVQ